jgi:hypothetical protein
MSADQTIPTPVTLPSRSEQRYLSTFGLGALAIFADATGSRVSIAAINDVGEALNAVRRAWPKDSQPVLTAAYWTNGLRLAQQVATLALGSDLHGTPRDDTGRIRINTATAIAAVRSAADRLQIQIVTHDLVLSRARAASGALGTALDAARDGGVLREFHRLYRRRRQAAQAAGLAFVSYGTARERLANALALAAANGDPVSFDHVFGATADEPVIK